MMEEMFRRTKAKDVVLILIASIAIVGFWRGVWNLMDKFLFPENFIISQVISIVIGTLLLLLLSRIK
ncbi:MAG TPA: hypothetical protein VI815_01645 [Candidatus Nanoarchaeia archaeon]|nr:hypothetical protein [Candidatus Nanoarchaeia archaeon]